MRVATPEGSRQDDDQPDFNPRHPCGWRPPLFFKVISKVEFQSTPPMRVATGIRPAASYASRNFNPRHPCGWRHYTAVWRSRKDLFQSTPPMRVATAGPPKQAAKAMISIHATHAGGDGKGGSFFHAGTISIHATHAGGDVMAALHLECLHYFNPRHPCGWRRCATPFVCCA